MSEAVQRLSAVGHRPSALHRAVQFARARLDDFLLSTTALYAHPLRSALTLLGIVIGVFTVVAMMALTTGLQNSINKGLGGLGADVFQFQRYPAVQFGTLDPAIMRRKKLTLQQALQLRDQLPQAKNVGAEVWEGGKTAYAGEGNIANGIQVAGGTAEFLGNNGMYIASGREFTDAEAMSAARSAIIGASVADSLFPGQDAVGKKFRLGRLELNVIGTIERQGGNPIGGPSADSQLAIPIGLFFELYGTGHSIGISVMSRGGEDLHRLQDQATAALRRVRGLTNADDNDFDVFSNESLHEIFDQLAGTVSAATLAICALSLLVGGIGVMNIMLVAVAERTREIGLRRALGARRARILLQFVIEAVLLALFGGCIGIALGYGAAWLVEFAAGFPAEVPVWAVVLGLSVSSGIGLIFGIYPAVRAARLDPAVGLRSE